MIYKMTTDLRGSFDATPYLEAGIHDNCSLDRAEYGKSERGNEFLAFYFKDPNGSIVSKTEWPVRMPEPLSGLSPEQYTQDDSKEKDMYESMSLNQMARIKHICVDSGYITNEAFVFEATTFQEFAETVVKLLEAVDAKDKKVRIKVVYDRNNFTSLPSYTRYVWIESMDIAKEDSKIRILSIDKMQRTQADQEISTPNPLDIAHIDNTNGEEDLPF